MPPGPRGARLRKGRFAQERLGGSLVKPPPKPGGLDGAGAPRCHALALALGGGHFGHAVPRRGQPSVAPMRPHHQGSVYIPVTPPCAGQTVEVNAREAEAGLDAMASDVAGDEVPGPDGAGVGHVEGRGGMPWGVAIFASGRLCQGRFECGHGSGSDHWPPQTLPLLV